MQVDAGKIMPHVARNRTDAVLREQVYLAIEQIPMMQGASFLVALVLAIVFRSYSSTGAAIGWMFMVSAIASIRGAVHMKFRGIGTTEFDGEPWRKLYILTALLSGAVWGSSAFLLFPTRNLEMQSLLILVIATLSATTIVSHSSLKWGAPAWCVPAVLPYVT